MGAKVVRSSGDGGKIASQLVAIKNRKVQIGVLDGPAREYAAFVEFGWVQKTTQKQAAFLNWVLGIPPTKGFKAGAPLVNPPRPFLSGTYDAEFAKWQKIMRSALKNSRDSGKALSAVGHVAVEDIKQTIRNGGTSKMQFQKRSPVTLALYKAFAKKGGHRLSKGGSDSSDKPLEQSGELLKSISFKLV